MQRERVGGVPVAGGGFEQCYNAQAAVAAGSVLVVAVDVVQAPNDKQQIEPMLGKIGAYPKNWAKSKRCCRTRVISERRMLRLARRRGSNRWSPWAVNRIIHRCKNASRRRRPRQNLTPVEAMAHQLKMPEGRTLYALHKQTPEPVFGIIKPVMGFRRFLLRGLDNVRGEWSLVTMAWNIKRMFALNPG
jgi:hypothetical protein